MSNFLGVAKAKGLAALIGLLSIMPAAPAFSAEQQSLTVVVAYDGKEEIFTEFHKKTGILIEFLTMSSSEVMARASAEDGKPLADLWFGGESDSFIKAGQKGLLEAYMSPEAESIPSPYKDPNGYWTGVSLVMAGFLVNTEVLSEKKLAAPETWADLLKPEYKDAVLAADPAISGTTFTVVGCLLQKMGEEEGWKYFESLATNVPFFSKSSGDPQKKVLAGEMAVAIAPLSQALLTMKAKSPVQAIFPKDGIPWSPAGMAIFRNARNPSAAKAFVDWALSLEGQKIIQEKDPRIMVRSEIAIPKAMDGLVLTDLLPVDIIKMGEERPQILATWAQRVTRRQ